VKAFGVILASFLCLASASAQPDVDVSVLEKLRSGGYVLYLRHTSTDFSQDDSRSRSYQDCANQRNLTEKGRAEARGGPARSDDAARYEPLKKILSTKIEKRENLAIAGHGNPFHAVAGPPYLAEGEIAVVQPEGSGRFRVIARIRLEDWSGLRSAAGRAS
jgi:hypothetical protein